MARAFVLLAVLFCLGCDSGEKAEEGADRPFRVVMVMDMAGLGDQGFNDLGWTGVQRAVSELGIRGDYLQSGEQADYVPNLSLAAQRADVVVVMGFLMMDAVQQVAPLYPKTVFVFVDGKVDGENIASYDFKAQEGAYLAGILAAQTSRTGKVGTVLGMDIPPVRAYEAGFRAGVLTVNGLEGREVAYVSATVGDFNNPSRGKALAQGLMAQGADVVLQLAGNTGLGVIEAVRESTRKVWVIGADLDQDDLAPGRVLVSVLKRIDVAVFEAIRDAQAGQLQAGHRWMGIAEGATGLSGMPHTRGEVSERALKMVERAKELMEAGELTVPWKVEDLEMFQIPEL
ncbi:MAG: BMP family ABC transporter substrate-binding protein [bacterium]|nr:BMP family ABC transporter substrate-binding protein [bacterium]